MPSRRTPAAARPTKRRQTVAVRPAHPPVEPKQKDQPDDRSKRLLVVGIGASAGGLEAFTQLLKHLPRDTGMAFVLVQHLDPDHESALTQILSRATPLPVSEVTHNQPLQADHVYIIPRDTNLSIVEGLLKLAPRERTRTPHRPIDSFFESLAQDQRERAIGVVLSGTASDGTLGLEAIKAEGGFTFAQDDSAKYDSMPRSAVATGCVDLILSPGDIAKELVRIATHPLVARRPLELPTRAEKDHEHAIAHQEDDQPLPSGGRGTPLTGGGQARDEAQREKKDPSNGVEGGYKKIMLLLRNHSGVDFSLYRSSTIQRRIARRIVLAKQSTPSGYAHFLRGNTEELDSLFSDVLISVTSFFRNSEAFDVLRGTILPKLLAQRGDDPVRCWVLGCSTGQEAYSLAISFVEAAREAPRVRKIQIFATDLNEKLLEKARQGLYAKTLAQDLSPERLRQFFLEENGGYRIKKALRDMVVFARQNLIADPPFSRMDLISCRNLLIYLDPSLQQKVMPTFHFALKPHGYLLLGASESVGGFTSLFEPVDRKHKIFSKKPAPTPGFHMPVRQEQAQRTVLGPLTPLPIGKRGLPDGGELPENFRGELNAQREADRIAVSQFAPPGVLINDALQVLQFRGPTGAYLEPPAGKASFDVLKMAREGLMLPLRAAINEAKQGNKTVRTERVRVKRDGVTQTIHVAVIPLKNLKERCFLVVFEDAGETGRAAALAPPRRQPAATPSSAQQELRRIAELEADLSETREYLQLMQEQHEAANEELQASNEEVQSANEELQSINEEVETSKEELESANEELTTVNEEMLNRNVDLSRLNNDLVNLHASTKLPIVLLGRDLTVRRFSPQAEKQFDLLATDVGRPISHIQHALVLPDGAESPLDLEALTAEVIADVREQEREVRDKGGRWHSLRIRPYLTLDNKVDGAVLVLVGIDARMRAEEALRESEARFRTLADNMAQFAWMADATGWIFWYNRRWYEYSGTTFEDMQGWGWEKIHHPDYLDHVLTSWRRSHATGEPWEDTFPLRDKDGIYRWFLSRAMPICDAEGKVTRWFGTNTEITELRETQTALRQSEERLQSMFSQVEQLVEERTRELLQVQKSLRLLTTELNLAEQRERRRLAGEMHDSLAQWLVICCLNLGRMQQIDLSPKAIQIVKETEQVLDKALDYSRTLMTELSPPVLREHGFPAGLIWLGEQMQRHGLTATVDVGNRADLMLSDDCTVLLFQSVRELLMNVLKHAESKEVAVRLFESDGDLCIEVRDEGAGFDLAASTPSMSSTFGLLSIRERMRALGGRFDLTSSPGAGTTATLVLPLGVASAESKVLSSGLSGHVIDHQPAAVSHRVDHSQRTTQNAQLHQQGTKQIRVLLVDDHAMVRQGLRAVLESYPDVEVVGEAGNGEEAVKLVERLQPTIVVMDINMPKMNGIKATAQITSRFSDIIVIGLSVQAGGENEEAMKKAGAAMLLTKEAAVEELYKAIRKTLDLKLKGNVLGAESSG